jgi:hypothetical protein
MMDIKFDLNTGRILSCTIEGKIDKADNVITVDDVVLPEDFMSMFPLGKYLVRDGDIVDKDAPGQYEKKSGTVAKKKSTKTSRPKSKKRG